MIWGCFWLILYSQRDSPLMCSQGMEIMIKNRIIGKKRFAIRGIAKCIFNTSCFLSVCNVFPSLGKFLFRIQSPSSSVLLSLTVSLNTHRQKCLVILISRATWWSPQVGLSFTTYYLINLWQVANLSKTQVSCVWSKNGHYKAVVRLKEHDINTVSAS